MPGTDVPAHWEADVVLRDGRPCHVRPIDPSDADRLRAFHAELSAQTVYFRYFAPRPTLSEADVERFTNVDHVDRVALVATVGGAIIGVGRYDRLGDDEAEVAFTVRDDHQGRGLGSVLLEHLAAAARERGIRRFVAEVLPQNRRMQATFEEAGFHPKRQLEDGYISLEFDIEPTARMRQVMAARERAAEARSIRRLLSPATVAVIGASRQAGRPGHEVLRHLRDGGFTGTVFAVHPEAHSILGFPCLSSISEAPTPVDLAIVVVPAESVLEVVGECAEAGVRGLVVMSLGFAEAGEEGQRRQRELVERARGNGMRVVGPGALGVINTDPHYRLNSSLVAAPPPRGRIGFFCQSGGLGSVILGSLVERGLGVSSFVSAGNRADVSGNDLLQHWYEDPATDAVLLYLESVGNPRKFARIARSLSVSKPIVAVRSGRSSQAVPLGHRVRSTSLPAAAVDAVFEQAGIIQTQSVRQLLDVAQILATQPLPPNGGVSVIATAEALALLAEDAALSVGLRVGDAGAVLPLPLSAQDLESAVMRASLDESTGSIIVVHVPPLPGDEDRLRAALAATAPKLTKPLVAVSVRSAGEPREGGFAPYIGDTTGEGLAAAGAVPLFDTVEEAVRALASVVGHSRWRSRVDAPAPEPSEAQLAAAEEEAARLAGDDGAVLTVAWAARLLDCFGIGPGVPAAVSSRPVVCRIRVLVDDLFGPVISFGLDGEVPELIGDRGYASPPLTTAMASTLVREPAAAALIVGSDGLGSQLDVAALEELLMNVGQMAEGLQALRGLDLTVAVHPAGVAVTAGTVSLAPPAGSSAEDRRAM